MAEKLGSSRGIQVFRIEHLQVNVPVEDYVSYWVRFKKVFSDDRTKVISRHLDGKDHVWRLTISVTEEEEIRVHSFLEAIAENGQNSIDSPIPSHDDSGI